MAPDSTIEWRAYPALLAAACLAAGILAADRLSAGEGPFLLALAGAGLLLLAARRLERRRLVHPAPLLRTAAAGLALLAAGALRMAATERLPADHLLFRYDPPPPEASERVSLAGRLADDPVVRGGGLRFTLAADALTPGAPAGGEAAPRPARGLVLVSLYARSDTAALPDLRYGQAVHLQGVLRRAPGRRNPADFDYAAYLARRGVYHRLSADPADLSLRDAGCAPTPGCLLAAARRTVRTHLARHLPTEPARDVLTALLLGERAHLDGDVRDDFARTGLMHLLAVSGLHVLLVGMLLHGLLRPWLMRLGLGWGAMERVRSALTFLLLVAYLLLAGAGPSVARAVLMATLVMGGTLLQRDAPTLNLLGAAAFLQLAADPAQLFDVGFQLSFSAVAALVVLNPRLTACLPEGWLARRGLSAVLTSVVVSLSATLGTMPVLLVHFGRVPLGGLLLNLPAIPLTFLTLASGLLLFVAAPLEAVASAIGAAADLFARLLLVVASAGDDLLGPAALEGYLDDGFARGALVAGLVLLAQWPRPRYRARLFVVTIGLAAAAAWHPVLTRPAAPRLELLVFDVGQGDAALVTLPNGRRLLVDAGVRSEREDAGRRVLLPHLRRFGIRALDALVVTHPHSDHLGGAPALLRAGVVERYLESGRPYDSALYRETEELLDSLGLQRRILGAGDTLALDPAVRIQVLAPERDVPAGSTNDASVVLRLVYGGTTMLLLGDAEAEAEERMIRRYGALLAADVVKVGHHGSSTSSTPAFVARTSGTGTRRPFAVVSVAARNRYGLPKAAVLQRWQDRGARVVTTAHAGAVWLTTDGRTVERRDWRGE